MNSRTINPLSDKYQVFRNQVEKLLPAPIAAMAADMAVRHSTRRCRAALAGPSLEVILTGVSEKVVLRPVDLEAISVVEWKRLTLDNATAACPDAEILAALQKAAPGLDARVVPDQAIEALGRDNKSFVVAWTGKDREWFTPKVSGMISLYDTVACRDVGCRDAIEALEQPAPGTTAQTLRVVFAGSVPLYGFSRQVGAMDRTRLSPRLLTIHPPKGEYPLAHFDTEAHAHASIVDFMHIVSRARVDLWHFSCTMNLYYQAVLGKLLARCPVVFEFNDTSSFFYSNQAFEYLYGAENLKLEQFCEEFVCRCTDGVIFQTKAGRDCQSDNRGQLAPSLVFPPRPLASRYLTPDPTAKGPRVRTVYAGVVAPTCKPREIFGDIHMRPVVDNLLAQGLHVDIYTNDLMDFGDLYEDYLYLASLQPEFGFHSRIHPDKIGEVLGKYHFGLMVYDFSTTRVGHRHFQTILPTKMLTYIEAGIPIIVSAELEAVAAYVEQYKIGLIVPRGGINKVSQIINAQPYGKVLNDFLAGREQAHMGLHINGLTDFYAEVIAGEKP